MLYYKCDFVECVTVNYETGHASHTYSENESVRDGIRHLHSTRLRHRSGSNITLPSVIHTTIIRINTYLIKVRIIYLSFASYTGRGSLRLKLLLKGKHVCASMHSLLHGEIAQ